MRKRIQASVIKEKVKSTLMSLAFVIIIIIQQRFLTSFIHQYPSLTKNQPSKAADFVLHLQSVDLDENPLMELHLIQSVYKSSGMVLRC